MFSRSLMVLACVLSAAAAVPAVADTTPAACSAPAGLIGLGLPLPHIARLIAAHLPIKIVAIGSSSTAGAGASSSAASYPSRLEVELKSRFPLLPITVLNRGVNGEEADQMLARFDRAVLAERPDLVIWQVGTNALLHGENLAQVGDIVNQGLDRLKAQNADVIVIDPQFAPKVIAKPETEPLVELLAAAAKKENVAYFHRFAVMRQWNEGAHLPFEQFLSPDGLHMNDWSYACLAKLLAMAITDAATRIPLTAHAHID
jgi:lysophospholipase L1-like esterase